jgi:ribonuclease HIII
MNYVIQVNTNELENVQKLLEGVPNSVKEIPSGMIYKVYDANITVYRTGKVLIQGKEADLWYEKVKSSISAHSSELTSSERTNQNMHNVVNVAEHNLVYPRVGSDESGKGDFFGPLVTATFMLRSQEVEKQLQQLGVTDSKKISDNKVIELARIIKQLGPYEIVRIGPSKYNELHKKMSNVNKVLGWSHARAIENVLSKENCNFVIADQFGDEKIIKSSLFNLGKKVELVQTPKGERDTAVAAASILARDAFLNAIKDLEKKFNTTFPLGAGETVIRAGILFAQRNGLNMLDSVAKTHFKTLDNIRNNL